jgi:hypothetical protein
MFLGLAVTQCMIGQVQGDYLYQIGDSVRVLELRDPLCQSDTVLQVAVLVDLGEVSIRGTFFSRNIYGTYIGQRDAFIAVKTQPSITYDTVSTGGLL